MPCAALAADALVAELEQRLASTGVESVNEHLSAPANAALLLRLHRQTAACELQAVSLAVRLARGANGRAVQAHEESLRALRACAGLGRRGAESLCFTSCVGCGADGP